ncbi:MAG: S-layer homology domain-containing protein [Eubacteriales bacterium]
MKIKKILILLFTVAIIIVPFTISVSAAFTDVPEDHPYKEAIDFCKTKGFVIGENATTFMPDFKLTRAHFAIIWCRSLNIREDNHEFTDITELRQYFDGPAIILNGMRLFLGTSETSFSPDDYITREQLALITMRTYNLGVASPDDYKQYADHASISDWARNGVSSCLNARVFRGLYTEENFKPNEPVTRAEICKLIYNLMPTYKVIIDDTIVGGTITASPVKAHSGAIITLTITPDANKQLKAGTLKFNDVNITGTTFIMPAKNVTITAEFEDKIITGIITTGGPADYADTPAIITKNYAGKTVNDLRDISMDVKIVSGANEPPYFVMVANKDGGPDVYITSWFKPFPPINIVGTINHVVWGENVYEITAGSGYAIADATHSNVAGGSGATDLVGDAFYDMFGGYSVKRVEVKMFGGPQTIQITNYGD